MRFIALIFLLSLVCFSRITLDHFVKIDGMKTTSNPGSINLKNKGLIAGYSENDSLVEISASSWGHINIKKTLDTSDAFLRAILPANGNLFEFLVSSDGTTIEVNEVDFKTFEKVGDATEFKITTNVPIPFFLYQDLIIFFNSDKTLPVKWLDSNGDLTEVGLLDSDWKTLLYKIGLTDLKAELISFYLVREQACLAYTMSDNEGSLTAAYFDKNGKETGSDVLYSSSNEWPANYTIQSVITFEKKCAVIFQNDEGDKAQVQLFNEGKKVGSLYSFSKVITSISCDSDKVLFLLADQPNSGEKWKGSFNLTSLSLEGKVQTYSKDFPKDGYDDFELSSDGTSYFILSATVERDFFKVLIGNVNGTYMWWIFGISTSLVLLLGGLFICFKPLKKNPSRREEKALIENSN